MRSFTVLDSLKGNRTANAESPEIRFVQHSSKHRRRKNWTGRNRVANTCK